MVNFCNPAYLVGSEFNQGVYSGACSRDVAGCNLHQLQWCVVGYIKDNSGLAFVMRLCVSPVAGLKMLLPVAGLLVVVSLTGST